MPSAEFYQKLRAGELGDDIDLVEWSSFYQMSCSVRERLQILQDLCTPTKETGFFTESAGCDEVFL
ncbi:hypothetical protein [Microcoleus sp.]|uniref:hypothetical protein n=1 Tax=Microcoleus sp. TaxID=44472 RepID=UPI00403EAE99